MSMVSDHNRFAAFATIDDGLIRENARPVLPQNSKAGIVLDDDNGPDTLDGTVDDDKLNGNGGDDTLNGKEGSDKLTGGDGNDTLDPGDTDGKTDTMTGGAGNDTYWVYEKADKVVETLVGTGNDFTDTVNSFIDFDISKLANVEILSLWGTDDLKGTGNAANNTLDGNQGDNYLDGGKGVDTFIGRGGDDTFILDELAEADAAHVHELDKAGIDTVITAVLGIDKAIDFVENYTFIGKGDWTFTGNGLDNVITGAAGFDDLTGGDGNDVLDGGKGNDAMDGGKGNDVYVVDVDGEFSNIVDASGHDRIQTAILLNIVIGGIEDYTYTGTKAWTFTGDAEDNTLVGSKGADTLTGDDGADTLFGNDGNDTLSGFNDGDVDTLVGGKGNDLYLLSEAGTLIIEDDAKGGTDTIKTAINVDLDADYAGQLIENLTAQFTSLTLSGNDLKNTITAFGGTNTLSGKGGTDTLIGADGKDRLDGGTEKDTMTGGLGNDTYVIDDKGDKIVETLKGTGNDLDDTVESGKIDVDISKLANIENVKLTGLLELHATGNAAINHLTGNDGNNVFHGGKGVDIFEGGDGWDTYFLDDLGEGDDQHVIEDGSLFSGLDTVIFGAFQVTTPIANVENYTYTGKLDWDINLSADGGNNKLIGGSGDDLLMGGHGENYFDGGKGADFLWGGGDNDTYVLDDVGDQIADSGGKNTIFSSVSVDFSGVDSFTDIELQGKGNINALAGSSNTYLIGNAGKNALDGGGGEDLIAGLEGDDTLTGGTGKDIFGYVGLSDRGTGKETITDFSTGDGDTINIATLLSVGLGYSGGLDAFADGYVHCKFDGQNTLVQIDANGGGNKFVTLVTVIGVQLTDGDGSVVLV